MDGNALLARIDIPGSLEFLARIVQHKSYSKTEG